MINSITELLNNFKLPLSNPVLVFSLILFIILLSPILLRKISIPGIIGLIISGVIIGPKGFNILEKNSAIDLFSTIGLLYIMFIAGLDLDLSQFRANRKKSLLFGFFTFTLPLLIGFPVCYYLLGYGFDASLLTASMFSTHTLIAYPIVSKLGVAKNQAVAITVGGTILTDTTVLILLAVIIGKSQGTLDHFFWIRLGISLLLFFAFMFFVIPRIAKWFFRKLESEKYSHYIFVLAVVFFAAFLAQIAGIEPIIGAFVAGLSLNRLIPHSSALMNRIEFIGNSLFIPFFLISVGMIVDVTVLLKGPMAVIIAITLSTVALFGKWFAALFTQLILRYSVTQRQVIFGLSSSHAAATLAVILVGYKVGILDDNILNGTVILILITCIVASFVTESAARKLVISYDSDNIKNENINEVASEHILLPIANLSNIDILLEFATFIKNKKSANPISILSCIPNDEKAEGNIIKSRNQLETFAGQASASENKINIIITLDHNPASGIARTSKEIMADIIIIGWPQKAGMLDKIIGDKVENLTNNTDKTIFICQFNKPFVVFKRMIIISPPLSQKENGFVLWFFKMAKLANELSIPIIFFANKETSDTVQDFIKKGINTTTISYIIIDDWDDLLIAKDIRRDDLIVLATARKGSVSYTSILNTIPSKLEKYYTYNCKILIYPQRFAHHYKIEGYESLTSGPLNRGIETIQKLGKDIGNIFNKEESEN